MQGISFSFRYNTMPFRKLAAGAAAALMLAANAAWASGAGRVTAHVLDVYSGAPAAGMRIDFHRKDGDAYTLVKSMRTNNDGRPEDGELVKSENMEPGTYRVTVFIGDYYRGIGAPVADGWNTTLTMEFNVYDPDLGHHLPFQITPWTQSMSVLPG